VIASSPSHGPSIAPPPSAINSRSLGHLDLEVADVFELPRHAGEEARRQRRTRHRRVLNHDGNRDGFGNGSVKLVNCGFPDPDSRTVIGRHHHHHGSAGLLRPLRAFGADVGSEMRGRHDHRHAARDMVQNSVEYHVTLGVGQHELLGEVSEDAEPVRAGIDHEIDGAFLTFEIEPAIAIEHRGHYRKYALVGPPNVEICHNHPLFFSSRPHDDRAIPESFQPATPYRGKLPKMTFTIASRAGNALTIR